MQARLIVAVAAIVAVGLAQASESPYVGMQNREIKSFSDDEIAGYLEGRGMGFAKPAELNSYPGPKHVLELESALGLSAEQRAATLVIFDRMHEHAVRLGAEYVAKERELDTLFSGEQATDERMTAIVTRIGAIRAELRLAHLRAHLEMRALLEATQIARYDELRGYASAVEHPGPESTDCPHAN